MLIQHKGEDRNTHIPAHLGQDAFRHYFRHAGERRQLNNPVKTGAGVTHGPADAFQAVPADKVAQVGRSQAVLFPVVPEVQGV